MASPKHLFGGKAPTPLAWEPLPHVEEWLENLQANGVTQGFIGSAHTALAHFSNFARTEGVKHPDELRRWHLLRFQVYLADYRKENGDPLALSYRSKSMTYIQAWLKWAHSLEYIENNPWVRIKVATVTKKPKPLEEDEIAALFDAHRRQAFNISPFYYHRRETILVLLYAWGLRIGELQSLTVAAMDMRLEWVTVRNKSRQGARNNTKVLPYNQEIKTVVQRWLLNRAKYAVAGEDGLLIDQNGKALSTHLLRKIVTDLGVRAGVDVNPHRMRDTFGTTMLDNDVPVERIMKMMGHTQRAQTLAYARVNDRKVAESHEQVMTPLLAELLRGQLP